MGELGYTVAGAGDSEMFGLVQSMVESNLMAKGNQSFLTKNIR